MKTRRFDFNWKPLLLQVSFSTEGSVPSEQNYNADTAEYTPDYTITPLIIQPAVSILDKDGILASGRINHALTNVRWKENIGGNAKTISTSDSDYEITTSGGDAGRIKVKRNVEPKTPVTLEFYAEYIDSRNGQVLVIQGSYLIACSSASSLVRIELDASDQTIYNPLVDQRSQTVTAKVWLGDTECPSSKYSLYWEIMGEDGSWHEAGSDPVMDYDVTVGGDSVTIDRRLMGDSASIRCRCRYSSTGDPGTVELDDSSPQAIVSFVRRIPKFEFDISGIPYNIPPGILRINPSVIIRTTNGEISNPETELLPLWYMATNKASGSLSYTLMAHGMSPVLDTAGMDDNYGAVIGLDVIDRGYAGAMTDSDGAVICDSDGSILIIH